MRYQLFEDVAKQFCIRNTRTRMETAAFSDINAAFANINHSGKCFNSYMIGDEYMEPYLVAEADSLEELKLSVPYLFL